MRATAQGQPQGRVGEAAGAAAVRSHGCGVTALAATARGRLGRLRGALVAAAGMAVLGLSGCMAGGEDTAPATKAVANGAVVIAGPAGYCVDPVATRERRSGAFVLLGACAALMGEGRPPPRRAVLTAAVSPAGEAPPVADSADMLAAYLATPPGRALLSRSETAATVTVLDSRVQDGVLFVHLRDTSPFDGAEVLAEYWRAILDIGPHAVSLSVLPLAERPLAATDARILLTRFIAATRAATAARSEAVQPGAGRPEAGRALVSPPRRPARPPGRHRSRAGWRRYRSRPPAPVRSPGD
ncbi:hypothetical protein CCR87_12015 [Rhodobaculum claviforme]|uniref:Cation transport ATPase n=2 Tax=Rhodobaculum claviforme TaxID=1549854 RepID=A0A934TLX0_9RHOB|nr:hypothetical protein [Rhodobaculum claviforme]